LALIGSLPILKTLLKPPPNGTIQR